MGNLPKTQVSDNGLLQLYTVFRMLRQGSLLVHFTINRPQNYNIVNYITLYRPYCNNIRSGGRGTVVIRIWMKLKNSLV